MTGGIFRKTLPRYNNIVKFQQRISNIRTNSTIGDILLAHERKPVRHLKLRQNLKQKTKACKSGAKPQKSGAENVSQH